ncbi:RpiR family transcriptional regulator [Erysipelothrix larvae]|uniref:RpiR family transcriptional regulator n=1 Tax=Erysipelothrix larvae TaxID=1514105 RepID=A0A109UHS4_9FIRM|nr:RpiR family transcriptional regulator [Erysipelothrix larvae]
MLLTDRLKEAEAFSDSEKVIAAYILENPHKTTNMTIHDLAEATYSSAATITRFCRKVKTDGFSEFKILLASELSTSNLTRTRIHDNVPFAPNDSSNTVVKNILNLNIQAMMDTYNKLDIHELEEVAKLLVETERIHVYGSGQSLLIAQDFQYKLLRIGVSVTVETQNGFQLMSSLTQSPDSVAFVVSYYGSSGENIRIMQALKKNGVKTILLTGPQENPLSKLADKVIHVPPQEELIHKMAAFSSRAAMQLVIDLLFALMFSLNYDKYQQLLKFASNY